MWGGVVELRMKWSYCYLPEIDYIDIIIQYDYIIRYISAFRPT